MIEVEQRILIDNEIGNNPIYLKQVTINKGSLYYIFTERNFYYTIPSHHKRWGFFERRDSEFSIGVGVGVLCCKSKISKHRLLEKIENPIWKEILEKELL